MQYNNKKDGKGYILHVYQQPKLGLDFCKISVSFTQHDKERHVGRKYFCFLSDKHDDQRLTLVKEEV